MKLKRNQWHTAVGLLLCLLPLLTQQRSLTQPRLLAQEANPTPPVINLTGTAVPTETAVATMTATPTIPGVQPDAWEPNDTPEQATPVGWGMWDNLSLHEGDVDHYTLYLKAGQHVALTTRSPDYLDTMMQVWWGEEMLAANDDRSATDLGSAILLRAPYDGWYLVRVGNAAMSGGRYALSIALVEPTATATAMPTATPSPTPTSPPTATVGPTITPPFAGTAVPRIPPATPSLAATPSATISATGGITTSLPLTGTAVYTLPLRIVPLEAARPTATPSVTTARVLVYYDANNNRQPEPGEGIANVSVLAVDGQGQPVARAFTNAQGEAAFLLSGVDVARLLVPFVSSWSARLRPGQVNDDLVLGLPAVRLPIFLPVATAAGEEE